MVKTFYWFLLGCIIVVVETVLLGSLFLVWGLMGLVLWPSLAIARRKFDEIDRIMEEES